MTLAARARCGWVTGGVVFGYRNVPVYSGTDSSGNPIRSHVRYEVHPEEAEIVRGMFRMRADGYGFRPIARTLNGDSRMEAESKRYFGGRRVPPPRKGTGSWAPSCVRAMLGNERYLGGVTWGHFRNTDRAGRTRLRVRQDPGSWIDAGPFDDLRIIDDDRWHAVRALDRRGEGTARRTGVGQGGNHHAASLLSGLSFCAVCGGPIRIAGSWKRQPCYGCGYHNDRGSTVCGNNLLESVQIVDRRLIEEIEATILAILVPEARQYTLERAVEIVQQRLQSVPEEQDSLRERLSRTERELQNLIRAVEQGTPVQSLLERIQEREQEKARLGAELVRLEEGKRVSEMDLKRIDRLIDQAVNGLGEWLRSDIVTAKAALRRILADRVVFHPDITEHGGRTYLLEARLTLGNLIPRTSRMSVHVPDGI